MWVSYRNRRPTSMSRSSVRLTHLPCISSTTTTITRSDDPHEQGSATQIPPLSYIVVRGSDHDGRQCCVVAKNVIPDPSDAKLKPNVIWPNFRTESDPLIARFAWATILVEGSNIRRVILGLMHVNGDEGWQQSFVMARMTAYLYLFMIKVTT